MKEIKRFTCELRSGACSEDIYLGGGFDEDDDTLLLHDGVLLPHWQEFANALQLYQKSEGTHTLCIYNMQLPSSVIDLLAPALRDKSIETFFLDNNEFVNAREGVDFAIETIQSNQIKKIQWVNGQKIESMDDVNHLVDAIISHPLIDNIRLENCFGENVDAYSILRSLLASNKPFASIDLDSNNIKTGEGTEIPDYLATNPPLEVLRLANNQLYDNDAILIARALKRNTNLRRFYLGQNNFTDLGCDALRNAIFDSTSLNAVAASNHSCKIDGVDLDEDSIPFNLTDVSAGKNRGRKIYRLLSSRHREGINVRHLDAEFDDAS